MPAPKTIAIYLLGILSLSSAAIYNEYPLVFTDSGSYLRAFLEFYNPPDRPIFYSIFLGLLHWRWSLWPVVVGQSFLVTYVVERTLTRFVPMAPEIFRFGVLLVLAAATSLPWITSEIMPDFFAALIVPVIALLVMKPDRMGRPEWIILLLILTTAQAVHYTHIALTLGALVLLLLISAWSKIVRRTRLIPIACSTSLAIVSIYAVNFAERREFLFSPYSSIFLLDRLISIGTAQTYLIRECPEIHYQICGHLAELIKLPHEPSAFMWNDAGPLPKLGGAESYRIEAARLTHDIIFDSPLKNSNLAIKEAIDLFFRFDTGRELGSYGPPKAIYRMIDAHFHRELPRYVRSLQYSGTLPLRVINYLDIPFAYVAFFGLLAAFFLALRANDSEAAIIIAVTISFVVGNDLLCGGLSSGDYRYQSRIVPLVALIAMVGLGRRWWPATKTKGSAGGAV